MKSFGLPKLCSICNHSAHGVHFGVKSCRACAAFFRRSIVFKKIYKCHKNFEKCEFLRNGRQMCRFCRYEKCLKVGMTANNVMYNYDSPILKNKKTQGNKEVVMDVFYEFKIDKKGESLLKLDISGLLQNVEEVFKHFSISSTFQSLNALEKLEKGLLAYRAVYYQRQIKFVTEVKLKEVLLYSNTQIKEIARFLCHSEVFQELCLKDKMKMLKSVWVQWKRLERFEWTSSIFGKRMYEENIITVLPGVVSNAKNLHFDCSQVIYKNMNGMKTQIEAYNDGMMKDVAKPLVELKLSSIELAFLLTQLAWHVAGKELQGKVLEASEKAQQEISNNLHFYYVNQRKLFNYAFRLNKILKVLHDCQKHHITRQSFMDLIRIFDYFRVDVSDKELYKSYF